MPSQTKIPYYISTNKVIIQLKLREILISSAEAIAIAYYTVLLVQLEIVKDFS